MIFYTSSDAYSCHCVYTFVVVMFSILRYEFCDFFQKKLQLAPVMKAKAAKSCSGNKQICRICLFYWFLEISTASNFFQILTKGVRNAP